MTDQRITRESLLPLADERTEYYIQTIRGGYDRCVIHDVGEKYLFYTCNRSEDKAIQKVMLPTVVSVTWREEVHHRIPYDRR